MVVCKDTMGDQISLILTKMKCCEIIQESKKETLITSRSSNKSSLSYFLESVYCMLSYFTLHFRNTLGLLLGRHFIGVVYFLFFGSYNKTEHLEERWSEVVTAFTYIIAEDKSPILDLTKKTHRSIGVVQGLSRVDFRSLKVEVEPKLHIFTRKVS